MTAGSLIQHGQVHWQLPGTESLQAALLLPLEHQCITTCLTPKNSFACGLHMAASGTLAHSEDANAYAFFVAKSWPICLVFGASLADCGHAM